MLCGGFGAMGNTRTGKQAYSDVKGGLTLGFRGGMTSKMVQLPFVSVQDQLYVKVSLWSEGVRHMVFGHTKPSEDLRAHVRCIGGLQSLLLDSACGGETLDV